MGGKLEGPPLCPPDGKLIERLANFEQCQMKLFALVGITPKQPLPIDVLKNSS